MTPALVLAALSVLFLLAATIAGFLVVRYVNFEDGPSRFGASDSWVADEARTEALQVAEQFALRMDAINGADLAGYTDKVKELLTTKGKTSFDEQFGQLQQLGVDKQTRGKGEILASALSDIDPDSATALVVHDAVVTASGKPTGRHYRWSVELERVKGAWRVDSFTQVE